MLQSLSQLQTLVTRVMNGPGSTGTVTFQRTTETKGNAGGNTISSANTSPSSVPCIVEARSSNETEKGNKIIGGASYKIYVPASYAGSLVDVDAKCSAVVTAWDGSSKTYQVDGAPLRHMQLLIEVNCTLEE